jgi:hypothetical protein
MHSTCLTQTILRDLIVLLTTMWRTSAVYHFSNIV